MKKKKTILLCAIIAVIVAVVLLVVTLSKSIPREAITFEEFKKYTEENNYAFLDKRDEIPVDEVGMSCAAFIKKSVGVEFTECISEAVARQMNENYYTLAENYKTKNLNETTINFPNYGSYTLETQDTYMHMTRVNNTIMHVRVPIKEKAVVIKFMKDLGYMK